jgi:hypothetical protein
MIARVLIHRINFYINRYIKIRSECWTQRDTRAKKRMTLTLELHKKTKTTKKEMDS